MRPARFFDKAWGLPIAFGVSLALVLCEPILGDGIAEAQIIVVEPPSPREEIAPPVPYEGAVWTPGYYRWRGRRHVWVGGRYVRPRAGYGWAPHAWAHEGRGWRMHPGHWERR